MSLVVGVVLCILSVVPLLLSGAMNLGDYISICCVNVLLALVAAAVFLFVRFGSIHSSYQKILQEEDYTKERKQINKKLPGSPASTGRWLLPSTWPTASPQSDGTSPGSSGRWLACFLWRCTGFCRLWFVRKVTCKKGKGNAFQRSLFLFAISPTGTDRYKAGSTAPSKPSAPRESRSR